MAEVAPGVIQVSAWKHLNTTLSPESPNWYRSYIMGRFHGSGPGLKISLDRTRDWPRDTAPIQGWVVDADSQERVAGALVRIWNEDTNAWGEVTADAHGSFRFDADAGRYSMYTIADGFPFSVRSVDASEGVAWANATLYFPENLETTGWYGSQDGPCGPIVESEFRSLGSPTGTADSGDGVFLGEATLSGGAGGLGMYYDLQIKVDESSLDSDSGLGSPGRKIVPGTDVAIGLVCVPWAAGILCRRRNHRP